MFLWDSRLQLHFDCSQIGSYGGGGLLFRCPNIFSLDSHACPSLAHKLATIGVHGGGGEELADMFHLMINNKYNIIS